LACDFIGKKMIGNYMVDFYCPKAKLVVEVDGGGHYDTAKKPEDAMRDGYMMRFGLTVLRFSDREVFKEMDGVLEEILKYLWTP
jgi:very-short-patch-repair endonuclease